MIGIKTFLCGKIVVGMKTSAWKRVGGLHPDSTSAYSEMPGEPNFKMPKRHYKNEQLDKAMKAPIDQDALRKAGM